MPSMETWHLIAWVFAGFALLIILLQTFLNKAVFGGYIFLLLVSAIAVVLTR